MYANIGLEILFLSIRYFEYHIGITAAVFYLTNQFNFHVISRLEMCVQRTVRLTLLLP